MKTLKQFAESLNQLGGNPNGLANLDREIAAKYAYLSERMKDIQLEKAIFWNMKFAGDKPLSDTHIETKWIQEEKGKEELKLKYEFKSLDKLSTAIKNSIVVESINAKNTT